MKKPTEQLLTELEARRKRWQSRLKRAVTELGKIEGKRKRLLGLVRPKTLADRPKVPPGPTVTAEPSKPTMVPVDPPPELCDNAKAAAEAQLKDYGGADLKIPNFLSRNPDAGTVIAAKKPEIDKKKMPLSDREALAYLKAQSAKVSQRRKKKELQLR